MKIYQVILYIDAYDELLKYIRHTFRNKNKAEETVKKLEEELSKMSEDEFYEKIYRWDYNKYWVDIEEYTVED